MKNSSLLWSIVGIVLVFVFVWWFWWFFVSVAIVFSLLYVLFRIFKARINERFGGRNGKKY